MNKYQEYQEALNRMEETYYDSDNSMGAMSKFKEDVNLLYGLVNECFEPKQETNLDHYKNDIAEIFMDELAVVGDKVKQCSMTECKECRFNFKSEIGYGCTNNKEEWLKKLYEKPAYKLTKFEKELLQCYSDIYKFKFRAMPVLDRMKEKGHFKGIDKDATIEDILANCEVIE